MLLFGPEVTFFEYDTYSWLVSPTRGEGMGFPYRKTYILSSLKMNKITDGQQYYRE